MLPRRRVATLSRVAMLGAVNLTAAPVAAQVTPSVGRAFVWEATGGVLGSAAGIGLGLAIAEPDECDAEDLACILRGVGAVGVAAAIAAPVGTYLIGSALDTQPSLWGAVLGSIAGLAAGAGVIKLFDETGNDVEGAAAVVAVSLTHGVVTAVGSRLVASMRREVGE